MTHNYFVALAAAKDAKPPRVERGSDKLSFGPQDPMNNHDALSLEDELERELRALAGRVNRAFQFGILPRRGADLVLWLKVHLAEVEEWNPSLAREVEETLADQAERVNRFLDHVYKHDTVTDRQVESIGERFEHNRVLLPVNKAAAVLTDFFGQDISESTVRKAARNHFGIAGRKDGADLVRLDKAIAHFHTREIGEF